MTKLALLALIFCINVPFYYAMPAASKTEVVHISMIFRHGNRMPLNFYPNDPISPSYWTKYGAPGELTSKGIKLEYDLGVALRKQYGFLNTTYSSTRVRVLSTDVDRTLMSAQAVMAGLFKPSKEQKWSEELNWYPIPIHTVDRSSDLIYTDSNSLPCPYRRYLLNEIANSRENLEFIQANKAYFRKASKHSGLNSTNQENSMIYMLGDTLLCEIAEGLAIPKWTTNHFTKYKELFDHSFLKEFRTFEAAKLFAGAQLNDIRNNLIGKANGSVTYELSAYSSHDSMMGALVVLLDMSLPRVQPPFGSALIFELRKDEAQRHFVRVQAKFSNFNEHASFQEVKINECGETLCPLEKFVSITKNKIVTNLSEACKIPSTF